MEEIKQQILGFTDWDASLKGRALNCLKGDNIERLTRLPDDVLKAALEDELRAVSKEARDMPSFSKELTDFWAALPKAEYNSSTRFLSLPKGVYFMGDQRYGRVVYVREAYDVLTAFILKMEPRRPPADTDLEGPAMSSNRLLVTGLPGSGKTFYNLALMKELASRHATVVVEWASRDEDRILFSSNGAFLGSKTSFKSGLKDPATYFLVDSKAPPEAGAITIETTSPSHEKTWAFRKVAIEKIMPPWARSELEQALPLFPDVNLALLRRRYKKWGGTVRWCLEKANDPSNERALEAGIAATNLQALLAAVGHPDKAATKRVISRLIKSNRTDMENFLVSSIGISEYAVIRGRLFEAFVHSILPLGGTFDVRDLVTDVVTQLHLPRLDAFEFKDLMEVAIQPPEVHCYPKSKTLESVDFLRQPDDIGQVTINMKHGASPAGLRKAYGVLEKGKKGEEVFLTWVVPAECFDQFKMQRVGRISARKFPMKQRVLKIPLRQHAIVAKMLYL